MLALWFIDSVIKTLTMPITSQLMKVEQALVSQRRQDTQGALGTCLALTASKKISASLGSKQLNSCGKTQNRRGICSNSI